MKLNILENKKDKLVIEVAGETHTFLNILREKSWDAGAKQASYMLEHPYLTEPKIIVFGKNPKKILKDAAQLIIAEAKDFGKEFGNAVKKK